MVSRIQNYKFRPHLFARTTIARAWRSLRATVPRSLGPARRTNGRRKQNALDTDQASAALVMDLKDRGLLDDTIVIWGGEFGRTPMVQAAMMAAIITIAVSAFGWPAAD